MQNWFRATQARGHRQYDRIDGIKFAVCDVESILVAPDAREADVRSQLARPAFSRVTELCIKYLPYGAPKEHRENIARFRRGYESD